MARLSQKMKEMVTENMRRTIFETSEQIILRDGIDSLTIEHLAREAEISAGSVYNYFENKEEIIDGVMRNMFDRLLDTLQTISDKETTVCEKLHGMAKFMFDDFSQKRRLLDALVHRHHSRHHSKHDHKKKAEGHLKLLGIISGTIKSGIATGTLKEVEPELAASVFLGMIRELQIDHAGIFKKSNSQELADKVMQIYLSGTEKKEEK